MSNQRPTNNDLAQIVHEGFEAVGIRFDKVEKKVETVHNYMIGQEAIDKAGLNSKQFDDRAWEIIKWLVLIVGAIAGVKLT